MTDFLISNFPKKKQFRKKKPTQQQAVSRRLVILLSTLVVALTVASSGPCALAQTMTVPELVAQKDRWDQWATDGTKLAIDGRFGGRAAQSFLLEKLSISFQTPRNNPLPDRMQKGQRIEVSGRLSSSNGRLVFDVNRLAIGETDAEAIRREADRIAVDQPEQLHDLAQRYEPIALFYDDQRLRAEIEAVRMTGFQRLRQQSKGDAQRLWDLAQQAGRLLIPDRSAAEVRYESLVARSKLPEPDFAALRKTIEQSLPGWNEQRPGWDEQKETQFKLDSVAAYNAASDEVRPLFHRRLFRAISLPQILRQARPDGSNGLSVAMQLRELLPEEGASAARLELSEISYRMNRVEELNRAEFQQLTDLLKSHDRASEITQATDRWIRAQDSRFRGSGLNGLIRTADEYLFVHERFQRPEHLQSAVELLKQAWAVAQSEAPSDAPQIAERLKRLGWERLKDKWMTVKEISKLPDDNIDLALREGRVVKGMTTEQVAGILGQPARVSRIASVSRVRELWIYDAPGSAGVVVQMLRSGAESARSAVVVDVTRTSTTGGRR